jgi:hypothetical protein
MVTGLQLMIIGHEFRDEIALPPPIGPVARVIADLTAPIARWRGYRARYERYSGPEAPPNQTPGADRDRLVRLGP